MRTRQFLLFTGLAVFASAELDQRDISDCTDSASALVSKYSAQPTPDSSLANFMDHEITATATESCLVPLVTGSLASQYTEFMSEFSSWYTDYASAYSGIIKACKDVPQVTREFASYTKDICNTVKWEGATGSATGSDNAAPRETGMAMAAAAVAGFVVAGVV